MLFLYRHTCGVGAFTAGQIDQIHFGADLTGYIVLDNFDLRKFDREYGVRSARGVVHVCRGGGAILVAPSEQLLNVKVVDHNVLRQVLHVDARFRMLSHF